MDITQEILDTFFKSDDKELIGKAVTFAMQTEAGRSLLNNHLITGTEDIKTKSFQAGQGSAYGNIEKTLTDLGFTFPDNILASEKMAHSIKNLQQQIQDVKAIAPQDTSGKIDELEAKILSLNGILDTEKQTYASQLETLTKANKINELNAIKLEFDPSQAKESVQAFKDMVFNQLIRDSKQIDGRTVYYDSEEKPYLNDTRDYASAEEIVKKQLAPILAKSNAGGDADSTQLSSSGKVIGDTDVVLDKSKFNTVVGMTDEFVKLMQAQGILESDERYGKLFDITLAKYGEGLKEY